MMGDNSPLKLTRYQSLSNKLDGIFANSISDHYRLAVLVRIVDYPDEPNKNPVLS